MAGEDSAAAKDMDADKEMPETAEAAAFAAEQADDRLKTGPHSARSAADMPAAAELDERTGRFPGCSTAERDDRPDDFADRLEHTHQGRNKDIRRLSSLPSFLSS